MLEVAKVGPEDVVYDLGSGDGRVVITAAKKHGAHGVGIDIDPARIRDARANAEAAGVAERVEFRQGDLSRAQLRDGRLEAARDASSGDQHRLLLGDPRR